MKEQLRILNLEDNPHHTELIQATLKNEHIECRILRVESQEDFTSAIVTGDFDVILADYRLPSFEGLSALSIAKAKAPEIPFIFVSEIPGEELAVEAIKSGAADYILKNKLVRLAGSIRRALTEAEERKNRIKAEEALRKNAEKYHQIFNNIKDIYVEVTLDGTILDVSPSIETLTQYTREECIGKSILDLYWDPKTRTPLVEKILAKESVDDYEIILKNKTNAPLFCSVNSKVIRNSIGEPEKIISTVRDISYRKQIETKILQAKEEWERTFDAVDDVISILDLNRRIIRINQAAVRLFKKNYNELIGKYCYELFQGGSTSCDKCPIGSIGQDGISKTHEITHPNLNKILQASVSPITDDSGTIIGFVHIAKDITHQKMLEMQIRQSQKMEAIGTLASGISHDFNNILSSIIGYMELVIEDIPKNTLTYENAQEVLAAGYRAKDLVSRILSFSRKGEQKSEIVSLESLLKEALKFLRSSLPSSIEIRTTIWADSSFVTADPTQLHQVMMNLCANAAYAMNNKGVLEISLADTDETELIHRYPNIPPGNYLKLQVKDTGHGIPKEHIEKIFDPYFTTKPKGEGTGLGLAIVNNILKSHNGVITVESEVGKGTVFNVYLPASPKPSEPEIQHEERSPAYRGNERILFVDDEVLLTTLATRTLGSMGYEVTTLTSSVEALEVFKAQPDRFDLVITDMTMPKLTGLELSKALLQIRPDIPIILSTGYTDDATAAQCRSSGIRAILKKPVAKESYRETIRQVLDQHKSYGDVKTFDSFKGVKILVAEDMASNRLLLTQLLEKEGFIVFAASNGKQAVQIVGETDIDLAVMDIEMPEMNGYQAVEAIRSLGRQIPVIALTGHLDPEMKDSILKAGMNDYLTKPIDAAQLFSTLSKWIKPADHPTPPAKTPVGSPKTEFPDLPGISTASGLSRVRGEADLFKRILLNFRNHHHTIMAEFRKMVADNDLTSARSLIHRLKGAAGNIGADEVYAITQEIELQLKSGRFDQSNELIEKLSGALSQVFHSIAALESVPSTASNRISDNRSTDSDEDDDNIKAHLKELEGYLEGYDARAIECMEAIKKHIHGDEFKECIELLDQFIGKYDYDSAQSVFIKLRELIQRTPCRQ